MKKKLLVGILMIMLFVFWTIGLLWMDRRAIGPMDSVVGYATMNQYFHSLTGVHWILYTITDWGGIPPIVLGMIFGVVGFLQWMKRRSFKKVDKELVLLGIFYITVFLVYLSFEFMVVNRRPVMIDGRLEASYPSSTTFLSITFLLSAIVPIRKYLKSNRVKAVCILISYGYMLFLVVGRAISGVHWFSDIIGSIFIGLGLVYIYEFLVEK